LDQIFGQVYRIKIGLDYSIKILDWIRIAKISNLFNTTAEASCETCVQIVLLLDFIA